MIFPKAQMLSSMLPEIPELTSAAASHTLLRSGGMSSPAGKKNDARFYIHNNFTVFFLCQIRPPFAHLCVKPDHLLQFCVSNQTTFQAACSRFVSRQTTFCGSLRVICHHLFGILFPSTFASLSKMLCLLKIIRKILFFSSALPCSFLLACQIRPPFSRPRVKSDHLLPARPCQTRPPFAHDVSNQTTFCGSFSPALFFSCG